MQRTARLRRALAAGALLASGLTATATTAAAPVAAAAPVDPVGSGVAETLAEAGEVDVVVMLDGDRPGSDVAALRRAADGAQDPVLAGFGEDDLVDLHRFETIPAFMATIRDAKVLDRLARRPGVRRIDVDVPLEPQQSAEEDLPTAEHVGATDLHALGLTGEGATVAVIDSGIDRNHPDLEGAVAHEACFSPLDPGFCDGFFGMFAEGPGTADDPWQHGTAASGIIAGRGHLADVGMAPSAQIVALKAMEECPAWADPNPCPYGASTVLRAGDYLVDHPELGVDVVSMSLGDPIPYEGSYCDDASSLTMVAKSFVDSLRARGTLSVASAGNESQRDRVGLPACLSSVVSVGATGLDGSTERVEDYSNTGPGLDLLAPAWTRHPEPDGQTGVMRGTSAAGPVVAGCAAVLLRMDAEPTIDEVVHAMRNTGVPVTRDGSTYPRLDCAAAAGVIDPSLGGGGGSAPSVLPNLSGTVGSAGWYTSDVTVTWDIRSVGPVTSTEGCEEVVVDTDTTGLELTCRATNASGTGEASTTVTRDTTPPVLNPTVEPNPVQQGAEATTTSGASDATSGVNFEACNPPLTDTVGTFEVNCQAIDRAGNVGSGTATYEVVGDGGGATCVRAPNPEHVGAGRATTFWGYAFAVGTRDSLGRNTSSTVTSLRQSGPATWERVSAC